MTREQLHDLLEELEDTQEIVIRRAASETEGELMAAWREAREDAGEAFAAWATAGGRTAFAVYLAAEDRADAAFAALAVF
jgi:hypothetical protein